MDRRFIAWLLLTASLFLLWTSLRPRFVPPEQPKNNPIAEIGKKGDSEATISAAPAEADGSEVQAFLGTSTRHVLGSLDPASGSRMLATLSSQGASIERIELVEQRKPGRFRYRALEGDDGYLGYLSLVPDSGGLRIQSVPTGSPAANAQSSTTQGGLQVGDIITTVNEKPVATLAEWSAIFKELKPGHNVELKLERNGANLVFTTDLIESPMDVVRVVDDQIHDQVSGNWLRNSCLTTLAKFDKSAIPVGSQSIAGLDRIIEGYWEPRPLDVEGGTGIEFVLPLDGWLKEAGLPGKLELVKRYRLQLGVTENPENKLKGYDLDLEVLIRNTDTVAHEVALRQEGFNGLTLEGWWYLSKLSPFMFEGAGARDVVYATQELGHRMITRRSIFAFAKDNPSYPSQPFLTSNLPESRRKLQYLGLDAQFFAAAVLPHPDQPDSLSNIQQAATSLYADVAKVTPKQMASSVGAWFDTASFKIEPGGEHSQRFKLFAGPKDPELLESHGLTPLLEYGWFGWVAKPLTWILHAFYSVARNYGIAIIMLTVMVRSLMFPLSRNAALNAQKMQEVAPELKRINELYKDDWDKRTKATQEVYKKSKFNPMAGCLPLFIQLPIFIGLYRAVSCDINLRQQPLIPGIEWCSNLAGPDMFLNWSTWMPDFIAGKGTGYFGPYFNLLPIITISLFIIQQKVLMPKATDEQQQMTQTMMMYMTVFMGVLFFKVPAGLCLYFITSSIWSLVERKLVKRLVPLHSSPALATSTSTSSGSGQTIEGKVVKQENPHQAVKTKAPVSSASQRPEKLSDLFPWFSRFEKKEEKPAENKGRTQSRPNRNKKKN